MICKLLVVLIGVISVLAGSGAIAQSAPSVKADDNLRVVITSERTLLFRLQFKKKKEKLEGSKTLKGRILDARTTKPLQFLGCTVVPAGAAAKIKIEDASAPQDKGKPGYIALKLVELTFADGQSRKLDGAVLCRAGIDKSDQGKRLMFFDRKGGLAVVTGDDELELALAPSAKPPPPECGSGGAQDAGGAGAQPPPPEPPPLVLYIPRAVCG